MRARFLFVVVILTASLVAVAGEVYDWRKQGRQDEKLANLIKVMPGTANLMFEMGERYKNLYWAARQEKWEFARYQAEEMKGLLEILMITRPGRAQSAREFIERVYPVLEPATAARDWPRFAEAFEQMRRACMECHAKNDHAFIELTRPKAATSPVLNVQ